MTQTVVIEKLGTTAVADVDLVAIAQSSLVLVASDKTSTSTISEYILASGALAYPLTVIIKRSYDAKALDGKGRTNYLISVFARKTVTDSVLGLVSDDPIDGGIYLNWPGKNIDDVAEARQFWNNIFCLTFDTVTAGVISDALLTELAYGSTQLY